MSATSPPRTRPSRRPRAVATALATALAVALAAGACDHDDFPPDHDRTYGDFGTEAFALLHDELLWSGTADEGQARAVAFSAHRADVVWALNAMIAPPVDATVLPALEALLPLYDPDASGAPGVLPRLTRDTAGILDALLADPRTAQALAQLDAAPMANPGAVERFIGAFLRHPLPVADTLLDVTLSVEPELTRLFQYLHRELPTLEDGPVLATHEKSLLQRLLDVELDATDEPLGPLTLSARFDGRGAPLVRRTATDAFPRPFVDGDGDGRVDVDAFGSPVDDLGVPIHLPTFSATSTAGETRDPLGRAIVDDTLVYEYFDLRRSGLAYILRDARAMLADGLHFDLFTAFEALLGGRVNRDDEDGQHPSYYVEAAPLLDLLHVVNELRRYPRLVPLIRALEHTAVTREPLLRQMIVDLARARRILADNPGMTPGNSLFEDIHPALASLARHGLLRELIRASTTPENQQMFTAMATQMAHTTLDLPDDMGVITTPAEVDALRFTHPTPWDRPDDTDADRSLLQKSAYLMWDTRAAPVYLKLFDEQEFDDIVVTHDMANLYVDAIAGVATLDLDNNLLNTLAVDLVDEFDDLLLSAEELNLFMNHDQRDVGNPVCLQGVQVRNHYGIALLALQASGNLDALRPWVAAIVREGRNRDFVDIFAVLAIHYSERAFESAGFVSAGTGFRRVEPALVQILRDTDFGDHFLALSAWMDGATFELDGQTVGVADELDAFLRWMLDTDAQMPLRSGEVAIPSRHGGVIARPSRLQALLHAFDLVDAALDADPAARDAWDRVDLLGAFLDLDGNGQLVNRHAVDLMVALVPILADEAAQSVADPGWSDSIDTFIADAEALMASRGFTAAADILARVRDEPVWRQLVQDLIASALAEEPLTDDTDVFGAQLQLLASVVQARLPMDATTQLLRALGEVLDPDARYVIRAAEGLRAIRQVDQQGALTALLRNLFAEPELGRTPIAALQSGLSAGLRTTPGASGPYSAEDFTVVLGKMRDWLRDDKKGAERLYRVILSR